MSSVENDYVPIEHRYARTATDVITCWPGPREVDPFARTVADLLLVEDFARAPFDRPRKAREWILTRGSPELGIFYTDGWWTAQDTLEELRKAQGRVRGDLWFLANPQAVIQRDWAGDDIFLLVDPQRQWSWTEKKEHLMALMVSEWEEDALRALRPDDFALVGAAGRIRPTYRWDSVMAPISIQMLEVVHRVARGEKAISLCRECGEPFLRLDKRRESFCNARERNRYNSRERYRTGRLKGFGFPSLAD